ncbi:hypothetical protein, partial [Micromonospora sp. NPDC023814]|uniref:hypothetical protein n=1 Tax=Micromonospora sp. NPDC023814 TaxID=3154596 RepID=UPI00340E482D
LHDRRRSAHPTMIQPERPRSSRPADEHLTSHDVESVYVQLRNEMSSLSSAKPERERTLAMLHPGRATSWPGLGAAVHGSSTTPSGTSTNPRNDTGTKTDPDHDPEM